ncbi:MAG: efflux RND transporter periplasmic adaptor subunit [Deltaproteobacteria bacterium]|nr:efflux RND transporter periplasmic adaptor subunit [Deltaproteobacteria bacterium]
MKKRLRLILIPVVVSVIGLAAYFFLQQKEDSSSFQISGTIEVTEVSLSFKIPGILARRLVDEGESVRSGQLIASLDDTDQAIALEGRSADLAYSKAVLGELEEGSRSQEIEIARAGLLQAKAALNVLKNGSRPQEIKRAAADLARAQAVEKTTAAQLKQARTDFNRYAALYQEKGVSKTEYDKFQTRFVTAQNSWSESREGITGARENLSLLQEGPRREKIDKADAAVKLAEAKYSLAVEGPRSEVIDQARARVQAAEAALKQAGQQQRYTRIYAPMEGIILSKSAEPGEYLNPAIPVVTLGDMGHPWLRGYINEKDLGRVKLGQEVQISTDSYPDKTYSGRVSYISSQAEFTPKSVQTFEERVKLMFRIKISMDNPDNELKPGMPADGIIPVISRR